MDLKFADWGQAIWQKIGICRINPKFIVCCKKDLDLTVTGLVTQAIIKRRVRMYENKVRSIMHHFLSQLLQTLLKGFEGSLDSENIILK